MIKLMKQLVSALSVRVWVILAGLCLVLLLLFKACSSDSHPIPSYRIGEDTLWTRVNLMGKERNVAAFSSDLLKAIAREEEVRFQLMSLNDQELMERLETDGCDGILTALDPTVQYKSQLLFSEPYLPLGAVLILPIESHLEGFNEKRKKLIAVLSTDPTLLQLEKIYPIQLKMYDNILSALTDVEAQRIDGAIFPAVPAYIYTGTFFNKKLRIATTPLTNEGLRLATLKTPKGEKLIHLFNEGLVTLTESGEYTALTERWGLINPNILK